MELDHIFFFVADEAQARSWMTRDRLRINYGRKHPGQGTQNVCACLDDVFLELLWLDGTSVSDQTELIGLGARGRGEALPLGIAWRGNAPFETSPYAAPFLPAGRLLSVATASLDPRMPMIFASPGGVAPINRTDGLVGDRQAPHFARLMKCRLRMPHARQAERLLSPFARFDLDEGPLRVEMDLADHTGSSIHTVVWE